MPSAPLIITWPGGIGNPIGEQIPISGGRRRRNTRRANTRRANTRRANRKTTCRKGCWARKSRRGNRKA